MSTLQDKWYRVPEAWLIVVLLAGAVIGSLSLVATATRHPDTLTITPKSIASPLPPSAPSAPADGATP